MLRKTLLIDCEGGATSVRHLVNAGHVLLEEAPTLDDVEAVFWKLRRGEYPDVGVVSLDTVTALATTNRHLFVRKESGVPSTVKEGAISRIWDKQLDGRRMWQRSTDPLIMLLRMYRSLSSGPDGLLTIFTAHERMREDETDRAVKGGPAVNPMLLGDIVPFSDDVFRLRALVRPASVVSNGIPKQYPKGTRFLHMATSEDLMTKIRIGSWIKYDDELAEPDLFRLEQVMGDFFPRRLTIFGNPGAGKTTLACSFSDPDLAKKYNGKSNGNNKAK
jgi:hypothetical protein